MPSKLSILVFIASPLDYARYRHAALYFEFEGTPIHDTTTKSKFKTRSPLGIQEPAKKPDAELESPSSRTPTPGLSSGVEIPESQADIKSCMMEVVGSPGFYSFHERINMALPVAATGKSSSTYGEVVVVRKRKKEKEKEKERDLRQIQC